MKTSQASENELVKSIKPLLQEAVQFYQPIRKNLCVKLFIDRQADKAIRSGANKASQTKNAAKALKNAAEVLQLLEKQYLHLRKNPLSKLFVSSEKLTQLRQLKQKLAALAKQKPKISKKNTPSDKFKRLFNTEWYLKNQPDVASLGMDPIRHYLDLGWKEGRYPNAYFDPKWYLDTNKDIRDAGLEPFQHYVNDGWREGRQPHPDFDIEWYFKRYPDIPRDIDPLEHYLTTGIQEGRSISTRAGGFWLQDSNLHDGTSSEEVQRLKAHIQQTKAYFSQRKPGNKIVVYTAIIGKTDLLKLPEQLDADIDYVCFSDRYHSGYHCWDVRRARYHHDDPTLIARYYKTHPHELFPEYDIAIWVDATLQIRSTCDLKALTAHHTSSGAVISTSEHPHSQGIAEEVATCLELQKEDDGKLKAQLDLYLSEGLAPETKVAETMCLISSPGDTRAQALYHAWWQELATRSRRDQVSLPYVLHKQGVTFNHPFGADFDFRTDTKYFHYYTHENTSLLPPQEFYPFPSLPLEPQRSYAFKTEQKDAANQKDTGEPIVLGLVLGSIADGADYTGTSSIRVLLPVIEYCRKFPCFTYQILTSDIVEAPGTAWADSIDIIFCLRNVLTEAGTNKVLTEAKKQDIPIIYDLDDNLLISAPNFQTNESDIRNIESFIQAASYITCSTEPLVQLTQEVKARTGTASTNTSNEASTNSTEQTIFLRPNALNSRLWEDASRFAAARTKAADNREIKILYMGTRSHDNDLKIVEEAARRIKQEFDNVNFYILAGTQKPLDWATPIPFSSCNYIDFVRKFNIIAPDYDFAICPLADSEFNIYKSNIKFMDYSLAGLPAVYSDHPIYKDVLEPDVNAIVTQNETESWHQALKRLITDPTLRQKIAVNAKLSIQALTAKYETLTHEMFDQLISTSLPMDKVKFITEKKEQLQNAKRLNYRTYSDLVTDITKNFHKIPAGIDLVAGIPRSGMIPAYMIGSLLNVNVVTLNELLNDVKVVQGDRKLKAYSSASDINILLVDDSINLGNSYHRVKSSLPTVYQGRQCHYHFLAIYATSQGTTLGAEFMELVEQPRVFQWNYRNHPMAQNWCYDIDGVLCTDPTDEENDDADRYISFIENARPLFIPAYKIKALVTSRLEKYRPHTEAWLASHRVSYEKLYMLDLPSKAERIRLNAHSSFKAEVYASLMDSNLFIESNPRQAEQIALRTGKDVICTENDFLYKRKTR